MEEELSFWEYFCTYGNIFHPAYYGWSKVKKCGCGCLLEDGGDIQAEPDTNGDNENSTGDNEGEMGDNDGEMGDGGQVVGKSHAEGGEKFTVKDTGQVVELESEEVVINKKSVASKKKYNFNGKKLTAREILSQINQDGGGVAF